MILIHIEEYSESRSLGVYLTDSYMYNDEYETLDTNLTDCNVGARKERNIRDNIFVINAIMNSIKKNVKNQ